MKKSLTFLLLIAIVIIGIIIFQNTEKDNHNKLNTTAFTCSNGTQGFFEAKENGILLTFEENSLLLEQTISASGVRYATADELWVFWEKGGIAFIEQNGEIIHNDCVFESHTEKSDVDILALLKEITPEETTAQNVVLNNETVIADYLTVEHDWMSLYGLVQEKYHLSFDEMDTLWPELTSQRTVQAWQEVIDTFPFDTLEIPETEEFSLATYYTASGDEINVHYEGDIAFVTAPGIDDVFTYLDNGQLNYGLFENTDQSMRFIDYGDRVFIENDTQTLFEGVLDPNYFNKEVAQCELDGSCDHTDGESQIPDQCLVWFDGCNYCSRTDTASEFACMLKYCFENAESYCSEFAS